MENFEGANPEANWYNDMWVYPAGDHGNPTACLTGNLASSNTYSYAYMNKKVGPILSTDYLQFDYRIVDNDFVYGGTTLGSGDEVDVYITPDCFDNFDWMHNISSVNHTPTTSVRHVNISLSTYAGQEIIPYFVASWGTGDWLLDIDNVKIGPLSALNLGNDTTLCGQDSLVLDAGGGVGFTYEWHEIATPGILGTSQTLTVTQSGTYYVIVNDGSGLQTDAIVVNFIPLQFVNLGNDTTVCSNLNRVLDAGSTFSSFLWSNGATTQTITVDTTGIGLGTVVFSVTATYGNGDCEAFDAISITFINCPGIEENEYSFLAVYPNPTTGMITIQTGPAFANAECRLYDYQGKLTDRWNTGQRESMQYDMGALPKGVYTLKLTGSGGSRAVRIIHQ
jgi:hypothetical protein